uniref:lipoprotein-releasing ABC transporter permease subunit n=1 Tax=Ningiella ruwaisensis TaxID=2364274 RepID=UPI001F4FD71C|nr:lipoprotein-releasing ABC transporter permease subunit [Ningiella ruwaisensis]
MLTSTFVRFIAGRFGVSKKQDAYIAFVSKSSTFGIGLGCAVLILLLSVMNGFETELREKLLNFVPHAEFIHASPEGIENRPEFMKKLADDPRIDKVFLLNKVSGLLQKGTQIKSLQLSGINQTYYAEKFSKYFDYALIADKPNAIILGREVMSSLGLQSGDSVQIVLPQVTEDLSFQATKSKWLEVAGEISLGGDIDNFIGIVNQESLSEMLSLGENVTHVEIRLHDPFQAFDVVREYGWEFDQAIYMSDWTRTHGHLYQDIQLVRTVIYIVLVLVICVASFNIVSSLVMSVKEKSREIAILKTMGAKDAQIRSIFILKGLKSGLLGASMGSILGCLLALYLAAIIRGIEALFGISLFDSGIYFTNAIPSELNVFDIMLTFSLALIISVMATLYPASKAAKIRPASHLH